MPVYKRQLSNGIFYFYKFNYDCKTYRSKAEYKTKLEAKKAESKLLTDLSENKKVVYTDILLKDLIENRLNYVNTKESEKYYKENVRYINILTASIDKNTKVVDITKNDIMKILLDYSNKQKTDGYDNYAVNSMLRIIKALFSHGIDFFNIKMVNPCHKLKPFAVKKDLKYIPTDEEINEVYKLCSFNQRALLLFVKDTYCRINEALNLRYCDIGDNFVVLYTRKSKNGNLVARKVAKPDCLSLIKESDSTEKVFSDWTEQPKFLSKKVSKLGQNPWNWHTFRHRGASLMSKNGVPLYDIMKKLGHSNLKTTQIYLQSL